MRETFSSLTDEEYGRLLPEGVVLLGYRGSIAHNCYVPNSDPNSIDDKDIMGVFIPSIRNYFGLSNKTHHEVFIKEWDAVSYELRKYVNLLIKANPNVLSLLWLRPQHYMHIEPEGQMLLDNRNLFVTKRIYLSFTNYAKDQLARMERFNHEGYMGDKRKRLVEKHGYDTKNAGHLIRLLRMGTEFLDNGELHVFREDAEELLAIKRGEWTLEQVKADAERLFQKAEVAYGQCTLPEEPPVDKIEDLLYTMLDGYFKRTGDRVAR